MRNNPLEYFELGFVDDDYECPPLSSDNTYPDYIDAEVKKCIERVKEKQNENTVTFGFMTDIHYVDCHKSHVRTARLINAYKNIARAVGSDKLFLGGDYTNEGCKEYKSGCYRKLKELFDGVKYYPVNGNHDDGSIWDKAFIKAEKSTNHLTHPEQYELFYSHLPEIGAVNDNNPEGLYYFVNDDNTKTRYICLDTTDVPYVYDENGLIIYYPQSLFALSQMQLDWLVKDALKFDEEGWSVVFIAHNTFLPSWDKEDKLHKNDLNIDVLNTIVSSYKSGKDLHITVGEGDFERHVDAKFSGMIRADVVAFFVGHHHKDFEEVAGDGTPHVMTENAVVFIPPNCKWYDRHDGDETEILFDMVTVDKKKRKIYLTRVGVGDDRVIDY